MQVNIEAKGKGYSFGAITDRPEDVLTILKLAASHDDDPQQVSPQMTLPLDRLGAPGAESQYDPYPAAPAPVETPVQPKPVGRAKKAVEKPQEAAPAAEPAAPPPVAEEPAAPAPEATNGAPGPDQIRRDATQACVDALTRNRLGVQALLTEFGVSRFRDLGDNMEKLQAFQARVSAL